MVEVLAESQLKQDRQLLRQQQLLSQLLLLQRQLLQRHCLLAATALLVVAAAEPFVKLPVGIQVVALWAQASASASHFGQTALGRLPHCHRVASRHRPRTLLDTNPQRPAKESDPKPNHRSVRQSAHRCTHPCTTQDSLRHGHYRRSNPP